MPLGVNFEISLSGRRCTEKHQGLLTASKILQICQKSLPVRQYLSALKHITASMNLMKHLSDFRRTATEVVSIEGAESKYRVAEILFKKGSTDESEKIVNQFIEQNSPHQYWMAKMFLLLADISIKKGDTLQARATLQSLREYYTIDNDGILEEVKAKLASLDAGELR